MRKFKFSSVILSIVLAAISAVTLILLLPAYQGAQTALLQEIQLRNEHDQKILQQYFNRYLLTASTYTEELSQLDRLINLVEADKQQATSKLLAAKLSGRIGESIHAFVLHRSDNNSLEVFNTALLGTYLPLKQLSNKASSDGVWFTQQIAPGRNNKTHQLLKISFPIISKEFGEVIATLHAFILLNDNFQIFSDIQHLTDAEAIALLDEEKIISGLGLSPYITQLLQRHETTKPFDTKHNGFITHQHSLSLSSGNAINLRFITENQSLSSLNNAYTRDLGLAFLGVLIVGLLTVTLLSRLTRSSLTSLVNYTDNIANKLECERFTAGRFEEFNRLGHTLEHMVDRLGEHEKQIDGIIKNTPNIIFIKSADLRYQMVSPNYAMLVKLPIEEVVGKTDAELYPAEHAQLLRQSDTEVLQRRQPQQIEFSMITPDGLRQFLSTKFPLIDDNGHVYAIGGIATDITDLKQAEARVQLAGQIFEEAGEAILVLDDRFSVISSNTACLQLSTYPEHEIDRFTRSLLTDSPEINQALRDERRWQGESQLRKKDGTALSIWLSASPLRTENDELRYVIIFSDISALRSAESKLERLSHYDNLTGLPNRSLFFDRLDSAIARSKREESLTALLFLNIDRFKNINDAYGHAVGDELLMAAAKRINSQIRPDDTVSRLGGDEFGVILQNVNDVDTISYISHRIQEALRAPFQLDDFTSTAPVSIGIALYPDDGLNGKELLSHADTAMYHVKQQGRNGLQYYDQELNLQAEAQNRLEEDLRRAIQDKQIYLDYQPRFDIDGKTILSAEALARWNHPTQGMIPPGKFIALAEQSGLIVELGRYILNMACLAAKSWNTTPYWPMPVSVNLSARQIFDPNLISEIADALHISDLPPELLELEITETLAIDDLDKVINKLERIREMGIRFSVDDFGTGYSSLIYLKRLPVDTVKIDRSFVMDVPGERDDENIISAIISMSHSLQLSVVAEGVETQEQLNFLKEHNCDEIQGFLLGKPGSADVMIEHAKTQCS